MEENNIFQYPQDLVGNPNGVVVLEEPQESPWTSSLTDFFAFEMIESMGDVYKLTTSDGETIRVAKDRVKMIVRDP